MERLAILQAAEIVRPPRFELPGVTECAIAKNLLRALQRGAWTTIDRVLALHGPYVPQKEKVPPLAVDASEPLGEAISEDAVTAAEDGEPTVTLKAPAPTTEQPCESMPPLPPGAPPRPPGDGWHLDRFAGSYYWMR